jgi:IgGFc binding protein
MKLMKKPRLVWVGIVILANVLNLHAQTAISIRPVISHAPVPTSSDDLATMIQAVELTTPQAAESAVSGSTFWSAQRPNFPPFPANFNNTPVWDLGNGVWLLDDVNVDYSAATSHGGMRAMDESGPPIPGDGDGGGTNIYSSSFQGEVFTTNQLWLQILSKTNTTAHLLIHRPWNITNGVYNLFYTTNILPPVSWQWVLQTAAGQTNLTVTNATDAQGFYRLGPPDSTGTDFWLTFCNINVNGDDFYDAIQNALPSLYISSATACTGTVTIPGLTINSSLLVVTNCGDTNLNGTYVLTNLPVDLNTNLFWDDPSPFEYDVHYYGYVKGSNYVIWQGDEGYEGQSWYMIGYDSGTGDITILYDKPGIDLNGNTNDWQVYDDTNLPVPTTLCAQTNFNQPFSLAAGTLTNVVIPYMAMLADYDMVETNGIHVTASQPVSVYGFMYLYVSSEAFTAYPTTFLGTNYCVLARPATGTDGDYSQLAIVATTNTTVTITPSASADLAGHSGAYTETLQQGQTYQINGYNSTDDVTGTRVTADNPIAVFAGASSAQVPDVETGYIIPLMQEQVPIEDWGTNVLALSFAGRLNGDTYRILAVYSNTVVTITGTVATVTSENYPNPWQVTTTNETLTVTLQAGEFFETNMDGPAQFQSTQPIQVAQFANGAGFDDATNAEGGYYEGGPCYVLLPPVGHYLAVNTVATGTPVEFSINEWPGPAGFDENYLNLIVSSSGTNSTYVDGSLVVSTNFVPMWTSGYYGAQVSVTNGTHTVTSSQPVEVQTYGWANLDAYGYFGGMTK